MIGSPYRSLEEYDKGEGINRINFSKNTSITTLNNSS